MNLAESSRHLGATWAVCDHVMSFFYIWLRCHCGLPLYCQWMQFSPSVKLQKGSADYEMLPETHSAQWWVHRNFNFRGNYPFNICESSWSRTTEAHLLRHLHSVAYLSHLPSLSLRWCHCFCAINERSAVRLYFFPRQPSTAVCSSVWNGICKSCSSLCFFKIFCIIWASLNYRCGKWLVNC